jgi:hypothetical protein
MPFAMKYVVVEMFPEKSREPTGMPSLRKIAAIRTYIP